MKPKTGLTPAALGAALAGNAENFIAASTPGGIEAQERAGQIRASFEETLPQEMSADDRAVLERLGFVFGGVTDKTFFKCKFPPGWRKQPTTHAMHSNLLDGQGRVRGSIFFKAAFYDYSAYLRLGCRYVVRSASLDEKKSRIFSVATGEPLAGMANTIPAFRQVEVIDTVTSSVLFFGATVPYPNWKNRTEAIQRYDAHEAEYKKCHEWLAKRFPDYAKADTYWD